ncbi:hypothetical protein KVV02_006585 [Mortierella alpina]|uniref:F-box domain-containing protein n=1 Tax=Mortierella alpina TaxID=64518 RepID=A0A9P8CZ85_MORAP|nr:hypothetical protein KVV02_006585 [Mortierella alpina]
MVLETNPLTLPELAMLIGQFLHRNDICACIRVSRTWQRNYEPLLYRSIYLDDSTMRKLTKERILQHIHHIRHLTLVEPMHLTLAALQRPILPGTAAEPLIPSKSASPWPPTSSRISSSNEQAAALGPPSSTCRNLLSIDIHPSMLFRRLVHEQIPKRKILAAGTDSYNMLEDDFWCLQSTDACIQLLRTNPSLRSLAETWDNMSSLHRIRFTQLLCHEPTTLVKMHLSKWEVYPEELNMLIANSPCLEHLRFSTLVVKRHPETLATTVSTSSAPTVSPEPSVLNLGRLKILILTYATIGVRKLQIEAPELQTLCITMSHVNLDPSSRNLSSSSSFAHYASSATSHAGYCTNPPVSWNTPRLEKLVFNRSDHLFGTATLLESAYALRAISFADYEVDSRLVEDMLARQASQLERIRLACYVGLAAKDIRSILTRCPNLKALFAPEILVWAGDLIPTVVVDGGGPQHVCQQEYQQKQEQRPQRSQDHWVCSELEMLSVFVCLEPIAALEEPVCMQPHHPYPYASMQVHQSQLTTFPGRVIRKARGLSKLAEAQSRRERSARVREGLFNELAKLTQLRHLDLSGGRVEKMDHIQLGLPMTLKGGLHSLAGLTKLEHVAITGWMDEMGREEMAWMKRFWPRLRFLSLLKTDAARMTRLQGMASETWPELVVQDKEWNTGSACPWTFFGHH